MLLKALSTIPHLLVTLFLLFPTACTLPQWNIALIVIGASAMLFTLVTAVCITVIVGVFYLKSKLCQVVVVLK